MGSALCIIPSIIVLSIVCNFLSRVRIRYKRTVELCRRRHEETR